jgi:2-C-methyl-D-erythritol 4-phosphate cytidylyltransferase
MKTVAIIPAGGTGTRMGSNISKQYLLLGGIPVLAYTLIVFQETTSIDDIFLILPAEDVQGIGQEFVEKYNLAKVRRVLPGGKHRQDSVKIGIDALGTAYDIVVVHDGVRPFVTRELVTKAVKEAHAFQAVTIGVPVKDTIKGVGGGGFVDKTFLRDALWLTQTPQAFSVPLIKEAYQRAYQDNYYGTDDAVLVERLGVKVKMLLGSYDNIKITTETDLRWGEVLLRMPRA